MLEGAPEVGCPGTSIRQREHLTRARKAKQEQAKVVVIDAKAAAA
jgi:hypothetical protein